MPTAPSAISDARFPSLPPSLSRERARLSLAPSIAPRVRALQSQPAIRDELFLRGIFRPLNDRAFSFRFESNISRECAARAF